MQKRQALKRLTNPERRNRILDQFNRENMDDARPVGGEKGEKFLSELNEMADLERDAGQKENPDR